MDAQIRQTSAQRVVVTGAAGFLGQHVVRALAERAGREGGSLVEIVASRHRQPLPPELRALVAEESSSAIDARLLSGASAVVHLASRGSGTTRQVREAIVGTTRAVIDVAERLNVPKLVYVSSLDVLLRTQKNAYAEHKREAESLVRASKLDWMILRPSVLHGPNSPAILARLIDLARRGLPVPMLGSGDSLVQPLHVEDLAKLIAHVLDAPSLGRRVYEVAGREATSYRHLLGRAAELAGRRLVGVPIPVKPLLPPLFVLEQVWGGAPITFSRLSAVVADKTADISAAKEELGFDPRPLDVLLLS